jgi:hypothetical protein
MTFRLPILCLLLMFLAACGDEDVTADIAGTYSFEADGEAQTVVITDDGKYVNSYHRDGALVWRDEGVWDFDVAGAESGITFEGFRFGLKEHTRPRRSYGFVVPERGYWFVVPERSWRGAARLCFDPDLGHCLKRG